MLIDLKLLTARRRLMGARYTHEDEDVQDASWTLMQILKMSKILLLLLLLIQNDLQCVSVKSPSL